MKFAKWTVHSARLIAAIVVLLAVLGVGAFYLQDAARVTLRPLLDRYAEWRSACPDGTYVFRDPLASPHWNGWGGDFSHHRFQQADMARLGADDIPRLKLKWAFGFPNAYMAFAQPTVMGGHVFVGSQGGKVYSLNARTGCTDWQYPAGSSVRSAIVIGPYLSGWAAYFGDLEANVHAVDALTGKALWKTRIEDHPAARITGSAILVDKILFVPVASVEEVSGANPGYACCTFRGSVVALNALTGERLWKSYTIDEEPKPRAVNSTGVRLMGPSGAGIWSSPTYDHVRNMLYVTTGNNYSSPSTKGANAVVGFSSETGKPVWLRQILSGDVWNTSCMTPAKENCPHEGGFDQDFGASAILVNLTGGRRALITGQKSGLITALDPDHLGEIIWQKSSGIGGVMWGMAADENNVYVAVSDVWLRSVPVGTPGSIPSPTNPREALSLDHGDLRALKLETGEEVWRVPYPGSAAVTATSGAIFSGGLDGHLRAYSAKDGRLVWDTDTKGVYSTVNGAAARGGSISGPGPVIVDGMLYVNSGYGLYGGISGNVLLAYSVEAK